MNGNKRLNNKGYMLLEAILAFLVLATCLMVYLPFLVQMLRTTQWTRTEVECARIGLEQVQKLGANEPLDKRWVTAGKTYSISIPQTKKGIQVHETEQTWSVQMETFITTTVE